MRVYVSCIHRHWLVIKTLNDRKTYLNYKLYGLTLLLEPNIFWSIFCKCSLLNYVDKEASRLLFFFFFDQGDHLSWSFCLQYIHPQPYAYIRARPAKSSHKYSTSFPRRKLCFCSQNAKKLGAGWLRTGLSAQQLIILWKIPYTAVNGLWPFSMLEEIFLNLGFFRSFHPHVNAASHEWKQSFWKAH